MILENRGKNRGKTRRERARRKRLTLRGRRKNVQCEEREGGETGLKEEGRGKIFRG